MEEKKLNLFDLLSMGVGSIIGSGIFAMMGVGIGMTGRAVSLALVVGCFVNLFMIVPLFFLSGVTQLRGGIYGGAKILLGKTFGGLLGVYMFIGNLLMAVYCIAIVDYAAQIIPFIGEHSSLFAALVLIIFFLITLTGTKNMAKFQGAFVVILILSLLVFVVYGIGKVQPDYFTAPGFMSNGIGGFALAAAILTFASQGANTLINFSDVTKNPRRNLPLAIVLSTVIVAIAYFLVGVVASGVLPISETAGQTLGVVARNILPFPIFIIFIFGGALLALASTLNNLLAFAKYPVIVLAEDGFLPKGLAKTNEKGYPYILMGVLFIIGLIPIVTGLNIEEIVSVVFGPIYLLSVIMGFAAISIPKKFPEEWKTSGVRVPQWILVILAILSGLLYLVVGFLMVSNMRPVLLIASLVITAVSIVYAVFVVRRSKSGEQVTV